MSKRERDPDWCPYNQNDVDPSTGEKCPPFDMDRHGVFDEAGSHECIENVNDVVQMSDGVCYSKSSLRQWYESSKQRFPQKTVVLPRTRKAFDVTDVEKLDIQDEDVPQMIQQLNAILHTNHQTFDDVNSLNVFNNQVFEALNAIDFSQCTMISELIFSHCNLTNKPAWLETVQYYNENMTMYFKIIKCNCIPSFLGDVHTIFDLTIEDMDFETIPDWIFDRDDIDGLSIDNNQTFAGVPERLSTLHNLTYLSITNSRVKRIPSAVLKIENLSVIDFSNNLIEELPEIDKNDMDIHGMLEDVSFSNNKLKRIPRWMMELKSVGSIYLIGNPDLVERTFLNVIQV
jgi:hypothetical protein